MGLGHCEGLTLSAHCGGAGGIPEQPPSHFGLGVKPLGHAPPSSGASQMGMLPVQTWTQHSVGRHVLAPHANGPSAGGGGASPPESTEASPPLSVPLLLLLHASIAAKSDATIAAENAMWRFFM